jgi:hypothetical protein
MHVAILLWHTLLSNQCILFHIENMAVVEVVNTATSKSVRVMNIVRKLVLLLLEHITIKAKHIPSKLNNVADSLFRSQWVKFHKLAPEADK